LPSRPLLLPQQLINEVFLELAGLMMTTWKTFDARVNQSYLTNRHSVLPHRCRQ
jgi:hypothetical protein